MYVTQTNELCNNTEANVTQQWLLLMGFGVFNVVKMSIVVVWVHSFILL
jgi:hypothetical protein